MNKNYLFSFLYVLITLFGFSQTKNKEKTLDLEEVVLTDSRFELNRENSGKPVIKIAKKELAANAGQTITQIINAKSGITINGQYGQAGNVLTTFVRGGQNRQVLVLIDGIPVSDASQIENNFDLNLLSINQIESIEILKGASSALYGNKASTAVINITLKKASKQKIKANISSFIESNKAQNNTAFTVNSTTNAIGASGTFNKFNYLVNLNNTYTDGLSAIREAQDKPENESDIFSKYSGYLKLGYTFSNAIKLLAFTNLDYYETNYDDDFGLQDADNTSKNKQFRFGISPKFSYKQGSVTINASLNTSKREFVSQFPAIFESQSLVVDAFNKYKFNDKLYTVLGVNYIKSKMNTESDFATIENNIANDEIIDTYANITYVSSFGLNVNTGLRLNNHNKYGSHLVYNINPSFLFKLNEKNTIKLLTSYSTAYIAPSLYQLFDPYYGNENLKPQEDTTIEAGFETTLLDKKLRFSSIYFNRKQKNYIDFIILDFVTYQSEYQNTNTNFKVNGVELELSYKPIEPINFTANYTFTEKKDAVILRIPKQKINAEINYNITKKTMLTVNYQHTGKRTAAAFEPDFVTRKTLDSYNLINLNASYKLLDSKLQLFANISNLFNEDYEEKYRFSTRGRNYRLGFRLQL